MSHPFNARSGPILVQAEVSGPAGKAGAILILDTGATNSVLNINVLRSIGYDPDTVTDFAQMTTGTTSQTVPQLMINRLGALGRHAIGLRVLAHTLPIESGVDGILGLDFFRNLLLTIDFRAGQITLS